MRDWRPAATALSIIFAAPFVALYVVLSLLVGGEIGAWAAALSIAAYTVIPVAVTGLIALKKGVEWDYPERGSRVLPLALIELCYAAAFAAACLAGLGFHAVFLAASYMINGAAAWIITLRYKISLHVVGIAGPATYMLLIGHVHEALALYVFSALVAAARHHLGKHDAYQLILGYVLSVTLTYIAYLFTISYC